MDSTVVSFGLKRCNTEKKKTKKPGASRRVFLCQILVYFFFGFPRWINKIRVSWGIVFSELSTL
jgi:hypothetical protein